VSQKIMDFTQADTDNIWEIPKNMQVKKKKKRIKGKQSWHLKFELGKLRVLDRGSVGLIFENHCGLQISVKCCTFKPLNLHMLIP
jgi:hypothetical protein